MGVDYRVQSHVTAAYPHRMNTLPTRSRVLCKNWTLTFACEEPLASRPVASNCPVVLHTNSTMSGSGASIRLKNFVFQTVLTMSEMQSLAKSKISRDI